MSVENKLNIDTLRDDVILCGPMLRRVETHEINVFLALARPAQVELVVRENPDPASPVVVSHSQIGLAPVATVALGQHLHVAMVTLDLNEAGPTVSGLSPGNLYGYDLVFRDNDEPGWEATLASLELLDGSSGLGYAAGQLPGFALPPHALGDLNLIHGSCRKPHGDGKDMLAQLDRMIATEPADFTVRPHMLLLTGDQIYADDVSKPFLRTLNETARELLGWTEVYTVTGLLSDELRVAIDDAVAVIARAKTLLDDPIAAADANATHATVAAADLREELSAIGGAIDQVDAALPTDVPGEIVHIPHFVMMLVAGAELAYIGGKIETKRDLIPEPAPASLSMALEDLRDTRVYCDALRAHLIKTATVLDDLASDASWGERDTNTDATHFFDFAASWRYTLSRIAPPQRAAELQQHGALSSDAMDAHLMFLGEWYAMYLMVWSDVLWDFEADEPRRIATPEEAVPNYGLTGPTSVKTLAEDVDVLTDFARDTRNVRRVLANVPTLMIFDDHEVTDDWNLNRDWVSLVNASPAGPQLLRNALVAYAIFQDWGSRPEDYRSGRPGRDILDAARTDVANSAHPGLPALFHASSSGGGTLLHDILGLGQHALVAPAPRRKRWDFGYPRVAAAGQTIRILFLDTRTHRRFRDGGDAASFASNLKHVLGDVSDPNPQIGQIAPPDLLSADAFVTQLDEQLGQDRLNVIVSPAPVFGLPLMEDVVQAILAEGQNPELYDQEAWQSSPAAFETLLDRLKGHDVVLLSGDVHYAYSNVIVFDDENVAATVEPSRIVQLCSSSLKNETALTRFLAQAGFAGAATEVFTKVVDVEMLKEYNRNIQQNVHEYDDEYRRYVEEEGVGVGAGRLVNDVSAGTTTWLAETASLFDPFGFFLKQKDMSLFSLPRILPLGLIGMGGGIIPVTKLGICEARGDGEFARKEFTVYFLRGPVTTEQPEVVGYNNLGGVRVAPDSQGNLSQVVHELHWLHHDDKNAATDMPGFTTHATLPQPQLFKQALARLARAELSRWRSDDGAIVQERRADGTRDRRATALLELYYRIAGLGSPEPDGEGNIVWSAAFISYLIAQSGGADLFVPAVAHIDYLRACRNNRTSADYSNPFWLFKVAERSPQVGDIVCRSRAQSNEIPVEYDNLNQADPLLPDDFRRTHCDVVVELDEDNGRIAVIGGNIGDSVGRDEYTLVGGKVREEDYFGLIAIDRHRPA